MRNDEAGLNSQRGSYSSFYAVLVLLLSVFFAATVVFVSNDRARKIDAEIERIGQALLRDLNESLRLSVENLRSASNFFVFFQEITYSQFLEVTEQNFDSDPGLLIIEWQRVVPESEREAFVRDTRRRGIPDFSLWEPDASGEPINARARPEHVPVYFMHSRDQAEDEISTLGLDLAWSPERMESKWEARDTGRARGSQLFSVVTSRRGDFSPLGFAITIPMYERGYVPADPARRSAELTGYMAGVYDLETAIRSQLERGDVRGVNIDIHGAAHDGDNAPTLLAIESGSPSSFRTEVEVDLFGNELHLSLVATRHLVREQFEWLWVVLPTTMLLFGLTTFLFLRNLEMGHQKLTDAQVKLTALNTQLKDLSRYDALTNVFNRRAFTERVEQEISRVDRHRDAVSLLLLDLDHFKDINDRWGHRAGDNVLVEFTEICRSATRNVDLVARLGGEEFAILLTHTNSGEALQFAERLRQRVEDAKFTLDDEETEVAVTVSVGISTIDAKIDPSIWFDRADKALYLAKQSGRNCVREYQ